MSLSSVQAPGEGEKSAGCVTCQQCRVPPTWLYVIQTFSTILAGVDAGGSNGGVRLKGEEDAKNVVARVTDLRERKKDTVPYIAGGGRQLVQRQMFLKLAAAISAA